MAESVTHICALCEERARRLHVPDVPQYVIDCTHCGSYIISVTLDQQARVNWYKRPLRMLRRRIKSANARGMRLDIDSGREVPLDLMVGDEAPDSVSGSSHARVR